jgi:hypothetical protein
MSTQLREILYTDSENMLVLSYTVALSYYDCGTYGITSPGNYGYRLARSVYVSSTSILGGLWKRHYNMKRQVKSESLNIMVITRASYEGDSRFGSGQKTGCLSP